MDKIWGHMLTEISQIRERQMPYDFTSMWKMNTKPNKKAQIQRTDWWLPEVMIEAEAEVGERGEKVQAFSPRIYFFIFYFFGGIKESLFFLI